MQIKIKINNIGKHSDKYIEETLIQQDLPSCLGRLGIPVVYEIVPFDSDFLLKNKHTIQEEDIVINDISKIVSSAMDADILTDMVLDTQGRDVVETYKQKLAQNVVDQLSKCVKCEYIEICHKITQNYLSTLRILR